MAPAYASSRSNLAGTHRRRRMRRTRPVLTPHATFMSTSPKIIPFRVLLRLFPRAIALLHRIVAARAAKWVARTEAARPPAPPPASQPELARDSGAV
jgi:hypothetical protein